MICIISCVICPHVTWTLGVSQLHHCCTLLRPLLLHRSVGGLEHPLRPLGCNTSVYYYGDLRGFGTSRPAAGIASGHNHRVDHGRALIANRGCQSPHCNIPQSANVLPLRGSGPRFFALTAREPPPPPSPTRAKSILRIVPQPHPRGIHLAHSVHQQIV